MDFDECVWPQSGEETTLADDVKIFEELFFSTVHIL